VATSPYTYQAMQSLNAQRAAATRDAWHWMQQARLQPKNRAVAYQRMVALRNAQRLNANLGSFQNKFLAAGRPGAMTALAAKYKDPNAVIAKLAPFDPQGSVEAINAKRQLDQNLVNLTGQENLLNTQYGMSRRNYEQQVPTMARRLLSNYAGRGMAFSTGYGEAVGQQNTDVANALADLDFQKQQALADITSQRGLSQTGYQSDLATSLMNTINRMTAKAGTLGLQPKGLDIYNDPTLLVKLAQQLLLKG